MNEPTSEQIELYYFDIWEVCQMVGRPHPHTISGYLREGKVIGVIHRHKWMVQPDQIPVIRELLSLKTNNHKKSQSLEARSLFSKLLRWWASV